MIECWRYARRPYGHNIVVMPCQLFNTEITMGWKFPVNSSPLLHDIQIVRILLWQRTTVFVKMKLEILQRKIKFRWQFEIKCVSVALYLRCLKMINNNHLPDFQTDDICNAKYPCAGTLSWTRSSLVNVMVTRLYHHRRCRSMPHARIHTHYTHTLISF